MSTPDQPSSPEPISVHVWRAETIWARFRGLLARPAPESGCALWISPCRQVHTLGMRYAIDVVHLDADQAVLWVQTLAPWRLGRFVWSAAGVLEMRAGEAIRLGLSRGDRPRLIAMESNATENGSTRG